MATGAYYDVPPPDYDLPTERIGDGIAVSRGQDAAAPVGGQSDLARLDNIDEKTLLQVIKSRFHCDEVQTYVGESLLVVNPYHNINCYGREWHLRYVNLASRHCAAPHVYHIADRAYRAMRSTGYEQCIVVSGESGAGKTETTKHVIEHVTFICADNARDLHERIVKVNPLLEAFGNALTVRNCNSSRFGKLVEMMFNERSELVAANVSEYMLEKSRVVHQASGEYNFHIFFYLFAGMPAEKLKYYYLEDPKSHRILDSAQVVWEDALNLKHYTAMFNEIESIFKRLNFDDDMKSLVYMSLAAILFLTNIEFASIMENKADESFIVHREPVNTAADLLCVNADCLAEDLVWNTTIIRGEVLKVNKNIEQAYGDCDALAKDLYARLFSWIVRKVNENLQARKNDTSPQHQTISVLDLSGFENFEHNSFEQLCINVANEHIQQFFKEHLIKTEKDIFTEEGIDWHKIDWSSDNPLLKLCLQKPIGLFQLLDEECRFPEGNDRSLLLKWQKNCASGSSYLQFFTSSRQLCHDGGDKKSVPYPGNIREGRQHSAMSRASRDARQHSATSRASRDARQHSATSRVSSEALHYSETSRSSGLRFIVKHYAGQVEYDARGFLEKNRDRLSLNLKRLMESSSLDFIKDLFSTELCPMGRIVKTSMIRTSSKSSQVQFKSSNRAHNTESTRSRPSTASQHFRNSLDDLVSKMKKASPHFIWCVKPNNRKRAHEFDDSLVSSQLRYNGIMQIALVRRDGFPVRQTLRNFISQYQCICVGFHKKMALNVASCRTIIQKAAVGNLDFAIGKTKVFLKEHTVEALQSLAKQCAAVVLQSFARGYIARNRFEEIKAVQRMDSSQNEVAINNNNNNSDIIASDQQQHCAVLKSDQQPYKTVVACDRQNTNTVFASNEQLHNTIIASEQQQHNIDFTSNQQQNVVASANNSLANEKETILSEMRQTSHQNVFEEYGKVIDVTTSDSEQTSVPTCKDDFNSDAESDVDDVKPSWDVAQNIPRERISSTESFVGLVKGLKVFTYIFIFMMVWLTATVGTGCFLLLVSSLRRGGENYASAKSQLIAVMIVPYILICIISFGKTVFGRVPLPSFSMICGVVIVEVLHNFGMVILVLRVLPCFGGLYGLGIMHSICLIPSVLAVVFVRHKNYINRKQACRDRLTWLLDVIAMVLTMAAVAMPIVVYIYNVVHVQWASQLVTTPPYNQDISVTSKILSAPSLAPVYISNVTERPRQKRDVYSSPIAQANATLSTTSNSMSKSLASTFDFSLSTNSDLYWQMPVALLLVSFKWWENFVGDDRGFIKLFQMKRRLHIVRVKVNIIISIFGIGTIIATTYFLEYLYERTTGSFLGYIDLVASSHAANSSNATQSRHEANDNTVRTWVPGMLCVACGLLCHYTSCLACKLLMQRASFCLPLCLAPPTLATCIVLQCYGVISSVPISSTISFDFLCDVTMDNYGYYVTGAALWYIVFLWICRHIWFPNAERIAKSEKLFVTPLFNGVLFAQSMIINRRRNDNELRRSGKGSLVMNLEDGSVTAGFYGTSAVDATPRSSHTGDQEIIPGKILKTSKRNRPVPVIYACATMWHETCNEMIQLLKSIFRMDADQCTRRIAQRVFKVKDPDYYEFEAHIFFDDCMDFNDNDEWVCNTFVKQLVQVIDEAASSVLNGERKMFPPTKIPTPYGGRLVWKLPGGNNLVVHLKDKLKIRHKKRWSQVMYMYYLLGFRLFGEGAEYVKEYLSSQNSSVTLTGESPKSRKMPTWLERAKLKQNKREHFGKSSIFEIMEESLVQTAENTFLLALDGDVDFKPDAVRLLVDRMIKNEKTGASCGRIHPIGSGPLVWYQNFEYAIGHWFQKATEHVLGCVLCSPGCFSLFRGSALMDDNVMKKYATMSTEARHFLQYDQGEDRWLCTLLLQQGYRVDYSAAADALTYCPDNFDEFFNQRRRWGPSTIANIWDLLADFKNTVLINDNVSQVYMLYQFLLMLSTVLGPSTIVITVASAFQEVLNLGSLLWVAYMLAIVPPAFYLVICFITKPKTQLIIAKVMCTLYTVVMTVVLVGLIVNMADGDILNPSLFFLAFVSASFVLAGLIHPYEFFCLLHGILYFICIPSGYLILMIYSMSNMHIVSWGTREVPKRKSKKQQLTDAACEAVPKKKRSLYSFFRGATENMLLEIKNTLIQIFHRPEQESVNKAILEELRRIRLQLKRSERRMAGKEGEHFPIDTESESDTERPQAGVETEVNPQVVEPNQDKITSDTSQSPPKPVEETEEDLDLFDEDPNNPPWIGDPELGDGIVDYLDVDELQFWRLLIRKYLQPIKKDKKAEEKLQGDLIELRNNASFGFWMVNIIWIILNFMLQTHVAPIVIFVRSNGVPVKCEPLGFVFIVFFLLILSLQVLGMLKHRWGTFLEVMMITELESPFTKRRRQQVLREKEHISVQEALRLTNKTLRLMEVEEPEPDYGDDEHESEVNVADNRDASDSDYDLVDVQSHSSQLQSSDRIQSNVSPALDELDPQAVRQKIRQHFSGSRKISRRANMKEIFQPVDASRNEEHSDGSGRALPSVEDHLYMDRAVNRTNSSKSWKKSTWQREYIRRMQSGTRERSTVRFRHSAMTDLLAADSLPTRSVHLQRNLSNRLQAHPSSAVRPSVEGSGGIRRDPRFVRANELERAFARRLNNMSA